MTPSTLLTLWLANWLVMSAVAVVLAARARARSGRTQVALWELENNLPGLVALLLVAWPVMLLRLVPVALPPTSARPRR
ncbi:hypothetical protein ACFC0S_15775 [Streptomyces sp. NPDC056084]|uniref:hypothetical protein n=1 Tax=unclassified Streptomyces TaxID=2593676 RepID=UPI0035D5308D